MAKIANCSYCNKEIDKSFFKGDANYITFGLRSIACCEECYNKYESTLKEHKKRFTTKLENSLKGKKTKPNESEIAKMYALYCEADEEQTQKITVKTFPSVNGFYVFDDEGHFSVREFSLSFEEQDITIKQMAKSLDKVKLTECAFFTKDDITRIEYAKAGMGTQNGLFRKAYSFHIRLNDEKIVMYKPCITRIAFEGAGIILGYQKSAEKKLIAVLEQFKKDIGSDLPIVKVKKIG